VLLEFHVMSIAGGPGGTDVNRGRGELGRLVQEMVLNGVEIV
jgi:phage tail tape-measure protein